MRIVLAVLIALLPSVALAQASPPGLAAPVPVPTDTRTESWFTLGAIATGDGLAGIRLQDDLFGTHAWSLGIAGALVERGDQVMGDRVPTASGLVYLARTGTLFGPIRLRAQLGLGGQVSADASTGSTTQAWSAALTTSPIVEGALLASANLGARWAVVGGPIVQWASTPPTGDGATSFSVFVGLQHR